MAIMPLSDTERQMAEENVNTTPEILDFLKKCEQCGLPTEDRVAAVQAQCDFCKAVLENFFPNHS